MKKIKTKTKNKTKNIKKQNIKLRSNKNIKKVVKCVLLLIKCFARTSEKSDTNINSD